MKVKTFFFGNILFKSKYFAQFLNFSNGTENSVEISISPRTFTLCRQTYLSYTLVRNFYLLVQLLWQDGFDTIAQQKTLNCKHDLIMKKLVVSVRSKSVP